MSKRRKPGEIVVRRPGSGFLGDAEPRLVRVPAQPEFEDEAAPCCLSCGDDACTEWANLRIVGGPHDGKRLCHIAECEMSDPAPEDLEGIPT